MVSDYYRGILNLTNLCLNLHVIRRTEEPSFVGGGRVRRQTFREALQGADWNCGWRDARITRFDGLIWQSPRGYSRRRWWSIGGPLISPYQKTNSCGHHCYRRN